MIRVLFAKGSWKFFLLPIWVDPKLSERHQFVFGCFYRSTTWELRSLSTREFYHDLTLPLVQQRPMYHIRIHGIGLELACNWVYCGESFQMHITLISFQWSPPPPPSLKPHCKLVPVQHREYENGPLTESEQSSKIINFPMLLTSSIPWVQPFWNITTNR